LFILVLASLGVRSLVAQSAPVLTGAVTASGGSCPTLPSSKSTFLATDGSVWFDFAYTGGSAGDVWFVEWYAPDGSLYVTNDFTQSGTGGTWCWEYYLAIAGYEPSHQPGTWKVQASWRGQVIGSVQFTVAQPALSVTPGSSQVITTVAGTPWIFSANGTQGSKIPLGEVEGVATDAAGNIYVADPDNNVVLKGVPGGVFTVVAGNGLPSQLGDGGPATSASLLEPADVAFDSVGNMYIYEQGRVRKVNTSGVISTLAVGFYNITDNGMAVDSAGNVYVSDYFNNRIWKITASGVVTVLAGTGQQGYTGDNGPATQAQLGSPTGVAVDSSGNVYIADNLNGRIRKVTPGGTITTICGGGTNYSGEGVAALSVQIPQPTRLTFDSAGNLYYSEYFQRVRKISSAGIVNTVAGGIFGFGGDGGPATAAAITWPRGIALNSSGALFIADLGDARIREVTPNGLINSIAGNNAFRVTPNGTLATLAWLDGPDAVALDASGNLYIADYNAGRIRKVTPGGLFSTIGGGPAGESFTGSALTFYIESPSALAFDPSGNLFVGEIGYLTKIAPNGNLSIVAGHYGCDYSKPNPPAGTLATAVSICSVEGVAPDGQGNVYFTEGNRLWKVLANGTISVVAGNVQGGSSGDGGAAGSALLSNPEQIVFDSTGNLYIADAGNNKIRKINPSGVISTVAGTGTPGFAGDGGLALSAQLAYPAGIAVDSSGNLYISDTNNLRVRKVAANGTISTVAGDGNSGNNGDGGAAVNATFGLPYQLAVSPGGTLYIADYEENRVRAVLPSTATFQVAPSTLTFSATAGGAAPSAQTVNLSSSVPGLVFTASSNVSWMTVTPSGGSMPGVIQISVDPSQLSAGLNSGAVTITSPGSAQVIAVTFNVSSAAPGKLGVGASTLSFPVTQGSAATSAQLGVLNLGGGSLAFTVAASTSTGGNWLQVAPVSGTATPATPVSLTVTANPGTLPAGTYSGSIVVSSAVGNITVPVTLAISAVQQTILLSQTGLTFTGVAQGGAPLSQSFGILNTGQGAMNWSASATTLSGGAWLTIDQQSGSVATPLTSVSVVNASVNTSGLTAGNYYGQIQVTSQAANSPQSISVVLNVLPPGSSPGAEVQPTGLIFIGQQGSNPGSQNVMVSNPQQNPITFGAGFISVPTGGQWTQFLPANATVPPNNPVSMVVQPNYTNLASGVYQGFVSLGFLDGSSRSVHVLAIVAPAAGSSTGASIRPNASGPAACAPLNIQPTSLSSATNSVTAGQAVPLHVKVVDNCGNPLTVGSVQATFSNKDTAVNLVSIGGGNWSGTWTPRNSASQVQINYLAIEVAGITTLSGTGSVNVSLASSAAPVTLGVANAASGAGAYIAPGGLVSIYGQQLSGTSQTSGNAPFPTNVNGTQVLLGGTALPLRYVGNGQINAQVPFGLGINTAQQLVVLNGPTLSIPQSVVVAAAQPGIYTQDQSGAGPGVIVDATSGVEITTASPAHAGDVLVVYCNGLGAVNPAVPTGTAAPLSGPPSQTVNPVTLTVGGVNAVVQFAGLVPGYPDLYQVNAVLPGVTKGNAVPVVLTVAGQSSPPVTIAVQ
jgi:uncharacterized protein (TIGR03437 family)